MTRKYDFAGWVTKNDTLCRDGVTIRHDAFKENHGQKVPLVWNHDYNSPTNVLGYVDLENRQNGVYGYGYLNDTEEGRSAKELIRHGDISSMSIGARKIKRNGSNVVHGEIYEVSLVLAGANPGAKIETVITHSDDGDQESGIIYTGTLIHSADDIVDDEDEDENLNHKDEGEEEMANEKTVGEVLETLNEEQAAAVQALLEAVVEDEYEDEDEEGETEEMRQNVFNMDTEQAEDILRHGAAEALQDAIKTGASSLKQVIGERMQDTL